ncbi:hypothetical protein BaRGS_00014525, partial [Batillaria attramentaria]
RPVPQSRMRLWMKLPHASHLPADLSHPPSAPTSLITDRQWSWNVLETESIPGKETTERKRFLWSEDREACPEHFSLISTLQEMDSEVKPGGSCYDLQLIHLSNQLHQEVWGEPLDQTYLAPKGYTGEPIGVDYLYSQAGKVLEELPHSMEELQLAVDSAAITEPVDESLLEDPILFDGSFQEADFSTLPVDPFGSDICQFFEHKAGHDRLPPVPSPPLQIFRICLCLHLHTEGKAGREQLPPAPSPQLHSLRDSVGPDNIPGYGAVVLANYLADLRDERPPLSPVQSGHVIVMCNSLCFCPHACCETNWQVYGLKVSN